MRLRKVKGAAEAVETSPFVIHEPQEQKGTWTELFGNSNPIHLEIGMGKGQFLTTLATQCPAVNYLGMERYDSVLFRALEKHGNLQNLFYLCEDAKELPELFAEGELARIYLNFSDPWPKDRHAKRRLTSKEFLGRYNKILQKDGELIFKTDNRPLFDFSLEQINSSGWQLKDVTYDLHNSSYSANNVMTEYEAKFSAAGSPIYQLIAYR